MHSVQERESVQLVRSAGTAGFNRRSFLAAGAAATATTALATSSAMALTQGYPVGPEPMRYPSPVWKVLDDRFKKYIIGNTPLMREATGFLWAEGPAWDGVGRYVVFSDIPNNRQMRWDEVTGEVTLLRTPSNFSNGNTFDWQGRQLSCEHQTARVVRYEYEGDPTILAESFDGKPTASGPMSTATSGAAPASAARASTASTSTPRMAPRSARS
jgi:gluconolactonase